MKKYLTLSILLSAGMVFAGTINEEMGHVRDSYSDFFRDFPKNPSQQYASNPYAKSGGFGKSGSQKVNGAYYNQVAKSSYEKQQIMQSLSTLAMSLANTAGSAFAFESAKTATTQAAALTASSDPQFQQMGQLLNQEAQQIANNDRVGAVNTAQQIQAVPPPYVPPNYQPTEGESVIVQAFNAAIGLTIQALAGVLGGTAISAILKALGIGGNSGLAGAGYNTGAGVASAAYNGQNVGVAANNGGAQAINVGAGAVQNQIYQVPQMQQPKSSTQGNALPGS